ncbi:hypothetical protein [Micromonospora saelicesensis]|uniref:Uncharacterized protein n=1 Tax=Micromonospora saelicesensis TaxID=285676 RepID=A0A1C4VQQ6_9ACTN|nr:hypothetical protein [Micromonospora saelicesensis]RAN95581.1 hypothetical protein GAR05_04246 [Micromonospora saelicesensis]RAO41498.1 hypothetical protein GAR06_05593 [Micromonospora saelicesensis]RAO55968.1 hypothetical protein PSN01_03445 [Micromonospora saelicesensis]RAO59173.1 hypothetical protein LUPAC06_02121 [Micromonospora saelicesensis]SCE86317.1 hypothetical protein GA0070561_1982 [Micromonospora saelicesensis]
MRRSTRARRPSGNARSKRLLAVVGTLAVFGGVVAVTQISSAQDRRTNKPRPAAGQCVEPSPGATAPTGAGSTSRTWQNGRWVRNHWGDGQQSVPECEDGKDGTVGTGTAIACPDVAAKLPQVPNRARAEVDRNLAQLQTQIAEADRRLAAEGNKGEAFIRSAILQPLAGKRRAVLDRITTAIDRVGPRPQGLAQLAECQVQPTGGTGGNNGGGSTPTTTPGGGNNGGGNNGGGNNGGGTEPGAGLGVLANDCDESRLQPHDGFQNGNRCVSTEFGEVGAAANNPSLLITQFPEQVGQNQPFTLRVSTRNLVRDRFLAAGQGGYYVESSLLNDQGLVRGHFHTACRMLDSLTAPPEPQEVPAFFVATEDGRGGAQPDEVTIQIPGLPESGTAQCSVWAGDGSHRLPMMERANQTPAFDSVRIDVN